MFEQTHGRSALKNANSSSVPPATPSETVMDVLGRAASSRGSGGRAVDDAGVDADLSVGRESRGGEDEGAAARTRARARWRVREAFLVLCKSVSVCKESG